MVTVIQLSLRYSSSDPSMSSEHTSNLEWKPGASTRTHESVASPSMAANPGETAHATVAPESRHDDPDRLDYHGRLAAYMLMTPDQLDYYGRLAVHMPVAAIYTLMSTHPNYTPRIYAAVAKFALMSVVAYLPGHGYLQLRLEDRIFANGSVSFSLSLSR
ncbi:hypothetical protein C8F01DRAFT_778345 [Mycena amicta]|nr:hypothetical protein C8F01DRAFT_778345 [Mycena amicta]